MYVHSTKVMPVAETNLHGALDDEELFIVEGSTQRNVPTAENSANKGLVEIMPKIPSEKAHPKHHRTSQRAHADLPAIVGNTARGAKKPAKTCHCRSRRRARPLPAGATGSSPGGGSARTGVALEDE